MPAATQRDALDQRNDRAEAKDHDRNDEHPEIELQPVAERVLGVCRPGRAFQAEEQQQGHLLKAFVARTAFG